MANALVIRTAGTNCDAEMVRAFRLAGAGADLVHIDALIDNPAKVDNYNILGFPGGFSYGDDIASGRVLAVRMRERLWPALRDAANRGVLMIGVCNGFQVMAQIGLLPGPGRTKWPDAPPAPTIALADNQHARFVDKWVRVEFDEASPCVWTRGLAGDALPPDAAQLPIAHGEGRFVATDDATLRALEAGGHVALRYAEGHNINGSAARIAGVCDASGRIFGLMPHPDRYLSWTNHPYWTRLPRALFDTDTPGLRMFRNAVRAADELSTGNASMAG
ncbi:MAG: phosphoribosylformylglycinamidine synthase subunit PurQ [Phycisphaerales bacterium]|nr:MAG: phosphoribosylformylglycinamidine synthase subunit PurQ [Phycisphaerales bacterium]